MRSILKALFSLLCTVFVLPCWLGFLVQARLMSPAAALSGWSQIMALLPGMLGVYLRRAFFRLLFPGVGRDAVISFGVLFSHVHTTIGRAAYLGPYCVIGDAEIGDDVLLGSQVSIMNGSKQHGIDRLDVLVREQPGRWPRITIGQDTWIGDKAIVMADVGKHCVVGAGSVVTKAIPDYAIVVGNPARVIGDRRELQSQSIADRDQAQLSIG